MSLVSKILVVIAFPLPLGFYSFIFQAKDIVHTTALRMEFEGMKTVWEMIDESRVDESSIFNFEKFNKMIFALDLEKEKKESSEINL